MGGAALRLATSLVAALLALLVASAAGAGAPPAPGEVLVEAQGALVSIRAQDVPLRKIVAELARVGDFEVMEAHPADWLVSVAFEQQTLDRTLLRVLAASGASFALVYDRADPPRLRRLVLLGMGNGAVATRRERPAVPPGTHDLGADTPLDDALELAEHPDDGSRSLALGALLSHADDERAQQALVHGTADADPHVRSVALGTIGRNLAHWRGAEEAALRALRDPAASVRLLALQLLWEANAPRLPEAMAIGASDPDPQIRSRAEALARREQELVSNEP